MSVNVDIQNLRTRPVGTNGPNQFLQTGIESLAISSGIRVDALIINGVRHGGPGGSVGEVLEFEADEYINRIEVNSGTVLDRLEITTNKGRQIEGGGTGGSRTNVRGMIVSLGGTYGNVMNSINIEGVFE